MSDWIKRKKTNVVNVGSVKVGGGNPISIQSMTNTETCDVNATINQINNLKSCLLYTSPSPRDRTRSRMPSSA